ncbi:uncharacterized protein PAC_00033 [Phialocephala subalpina]|uniref:Protein kinase domain-containing protein n=1 Tax=Phialocephala subalpina TaxID=576137 RepID=A0A1L7WBL3_9HELO|nr:uncharacterized protein PAC_00033 [Phialocephala subalpina]
MCSIIATIVNIFKRLIKPGGRVPGSNPSQQDTSESQPLVSESSDQPVESEPSPTPADPNLESESLATSSDLLKKIRSKLPGGTERSDDELESFVTINSLKNIWTNEVKVEDFVAVVIQPRVSSVVPVEFVRENLLTTLTILVDIGWEDWQNFVLFYVNHKNSQGKNDRLDDGIPSLTRSALQSFLGTTYGWLFFRARHIYTPIVVTEGTSETYDKGRRLPFVNEGKLLGEGASGKVYEETIAGGQLRLLSQVGYHMEFKRMNREYPVARKCLKGKDISEKDLKLRENEVQNVKRFRGKLSHDRIAAFLAIITIGEDISILQPLAAMDLKKFLYEQGNLLLRHPMDPMDPIHLIQETAHLAGALKFLHNLQIEINQEVCCHMDLKPANILVFDVEGSPVGKWKITDFGISSFHTLQKHGHDARDKPMDSSNLLAPSEFVQKRSVLTKPRRAEGPYQAPEVDGLEEKTAGRGSDIWSLGCIFWQVLIFGIRGSEELKVMDAKRYKRENGMSYGNDYFYYKESDKFFLKPEVNDWVEQELRHHFRDSTAWETCRHLFGKIFQIEKKDRYSAEDVQQKLEKVKQELGNIEIRRDSRPPDTAESNEQYGFDRTNQLPTIIVGPTEQE